MGYQLRDLCINNKVSCVCPSSSPFLALSMLSHLQQTRLKHDSFASIIPLPLATKNITTAWPNIRLVALCAVGALGFVPCHQDATRCLTQRMLFLFKWRWAMVDKAPAIQEYSPVDKVTYELFILETKAPNSRSDKIKRVPQAVNRQNLTQQRSGSMMAFYSLGLISGMFLMSDGKIPYNALHRSTFSLYSSGTFFSSAQPFVCSGDCCPYLHVCVPIDLSTA
jgi:hypothetical protein